MIIDEILNIKDEGRKEASADNIIYILKEAEIFKFDYILKASKASPDDPLKCFFKTPEVIKMLNKKFQGALIKYIVNNDYNLDIIKDVFKISWINKNNFNIIKDYWKNKLIENNKDIFYIDK